MAPEVTAERFLAASGAGFLAVGPKGVPPTVTYFASAKDRPIWMISTESYPRTPFAADFTSAWAAFSNFTEQAYVLRDPEYWERKLVAWSLDVNLPSATAMSNARPWPQIVAFTTPRERTVPLEQDEEQLSVTTLHRRPPVMALEPAWLDAIDARLQHLLGLPRSWDSYGAEVISVDAARRALSFLLRVLGAHERPPEVVPGADGSLQLEWHTAAADLEVQVPAHGTLSVWYRDEQSGEESEFECLPDGPGFERLLRLYAVVDDTAAPHAA